MKKFTLLLTSLVASVGTMFAAVPANGVYKLWHLNAENAGTRGYMIQNLTTNTLHPRGARLNGYTDAISSVPADAEGSWNEEWYLYTSDVTGYSYIFSVNNGKFLAYDNGIGKDKVFNLSDTPATFVIEDASTASQYKIRATSSTAYYFGNSIGYEKDNSSNHTVNTTYRCNTPADDAVPHSFAAVTVSGADEVINAAIAKIVKKETVQKSYVENDAIWTPSPVYPAGLSNDSSSNGHDTADHVGVSGHTIYKAVIPVNISLGLDVTTTVRYDDGNHAILILGTDVVDASGNVVANDYHVGFSGTSHFNNVYTLQNVAAGNYMLRIYVCSDGTHNSLSKTKGTITVKCASELSTEEAEAMFDSLVAIAERDFPSVPGYYELTDAIKTAMAATAEDAAGYAKNFAALDDAMETKTIALPKAGKFYRIKNNHDSDASKTGYLVGKAGSTERTVFDDVDEGSPESIFYYTGEKLVSYTTGYYLAISNNFLHYTTTKGAAAGTTFTFAAATYGKLHVIFNGNRYLYSDGQTSTNAGEGVTSSSNGFQNYCFTISEVEWLPVPMEDENFGWTTFYSPVQLNLSGRVTAYTGVLNEGNAAELVVTEQSAVPANTGVIIGLLEDAQVDNGCVYLKVEETTLTDVESDLIGSFEVVDVPTNPATAVADTEASAESVYCFKFEKDTNSVNEKDFGEFNFVSEGEFKAFSAHIERNSYDDIETISIVDQSGNNPTTGIEEIVVETEKVQGIYDLQGRRLSAPVKGINIINGKKVLVK